MRIESRSISQEKHWSTPVLPSWAPDWRIPRKESSIVQESKWIELIDLNAQDTERKVLLKRNPQRIILEGVVIDSIMEVAPMFCVDIEPSGDFNIYCKQFFAHLEQLNAMLIRNGFDRDYATGESPSMAFMRTVLLDGKGQAPCRTSDLKNPDGIVDLWLDLEDYCSRDVSILNQKSQVRLRINGGQACSATEFSYCSSTAVRDRKLMITNTGLIGIGPKYARPGDTVVIFAGVEAPFVLRTVGKTTSKFCENGVSLSGEDVDTADIPDMWELIGDCYLHGFMEKQALRRNFNEKREIFNII